VTGADDTGRGLAWFEVVVPDAAALDAVRARTDAVAAERNLELAVAERDDGIAVTDADGIEVRVRAEQPVVADRFRSTRVSLTRRSSGASIRSGTW